MTLDDRIFCLQRTQLPSDLLTKLRDADVAYLQDRDNMALKLVNEIESECKDRNISIYIPKYAFH